MTALVLCPCGHAVSVHEPGGCRGDRVMRCPCRFSPVNAMEAAVDDARSSYVLDHGYGAQREATADISHAAGGVL